MAIRFGETDARDMGRAAAGVKGIELGEGNAVVGAVRVPMAPRSGTADEFDTHPDAIAGNLCLLTITEHGYGKRTPVDQYRVRPETGPARSQTRGGKGRADIKTTARNGRSIAAVGVHDGDDVVVISRGGQLVRLPAASISEYGRGTQGVRVVSLHEGDAVVAATRVEPVGDEPDPAG